MCDDTQLLLESLLNHFLVRLRRGEMPRISDYEAAHPEHAPEIRDFFEASVMVEQMARRRQPEEPASITPQRLGDYRIVREIGRGGMGIVYEAEQESLSRRVAVKVLPPSARLNPNGLKRFDREARTGARLHHTNIVPVFGVGHDHGFDYIVMPLIRGVGLDQILERISGVEDSESSFVGSDHETAVVDDALAVALALVAGRFRPLPTSGTTTAPMEIEDNGEIEDFRSNSPVNADVTRASKLALGPAYWQSVARVGIQAARALQYAHSRGTIHHDIKPGNLLVDLQGNVWISDFGLAKAVDQEQASQTGEITGTLRYMAPERFKGSADNRSDLYSLGLTLYEMLTLRPAFEHTNPSDLLHRITNEQPASPRSLNRRIPKDLETVVLKTISREPGHRYASSGELADDLERFLDDRPIRARRVNWAEQVWRWSRRNRAVASLAGLAVVLFALVVVVASVGYIRTRIANRQVREALSGESHQRQVAESQRQKAENLSDLTLSALDDIFEQFVPSRIRESPVLVFDAPKSAEIRVRAQPAISKENAAMLDRMLAFYNRLAEEEGNERRVLSRIADANRRVGDIRRRLGQVDQAEIAYRRAFDGYRLLLHAASTDRLFAVQTARIQNSLGDLCWSDRREKEGRSFHLQAIAVLKELPPDSLEAQYELARSYYFLGRGGPPDKPIGPPPPPDKPGPREKVPPSFAPSPKPGQAGEAPPTESDTQSNEDNLRQAIRILEDLEHNHPLDPECRHLLACCYRDLPPSAGPPQSKTPFEATDRAIEILKKLVDDFPNVPDFRHDLGKTYAKLNLRDWPEDASLIHFAESRLSNALSILEPLLADHPNVPDYQASRVQILFTLSEVLTYAHRTDEAEKALRSALVAQTAITRQYPEAFPYEGWKAIIEDSLARLLVERGRDAEARKIWDSSIASMEEVLRRHPQASYLHAVVVQSYLDLAELLKDMGEQRLATEMLSRGQEHRPGRPPLGPPIGEADGSGETPIPKDDPVR